MNNNEKNYIVRPATGLVTCDDSPRLGGVRQSDATAPERDWEFNNDLPVTRSVVRRSSNHTVDRVITVDASPSPRDSLAAKQPPIAAVRRRPVTLFAVALSLLGQTVLGLVIALRDPDPVIAALSSASLLVCSVLLIICEQIGANR